MRLFKRSFVSPFTFQFFLRYPLRHSSVVPALSSRPRGIEATLNHQEGYTEYTNAATREEQAAAYSESSYLCDAQTLLLAYTLRRHCIKPLFHQLSPLRAIRVRGD